MLAKPNGCKPCPLYQDGRGFVPDETREDAKVFILGQNPGADEEAEGRPFVGPTGEALERDYLPRSGLTRQDVSLGNVLRCRLIQNGRRTNDLPTGNVLRLAVAQCRQYLVIPTATKLVVACGALAWSAVEGPKSISKWRGFLKPKDK